ncbi:MAG: leucyl/phenylalanyl-tRNA--protein transferase [Hyphomonadaceae bacterium]
MKPFTTDDLVACYRQGVFPMAQGRDRTGVFIVDPDERCIFPLERFHVPRRLRRTLRSGRFAFSVDRDFRAVMEACAAPAPGRTETWINRDIHALYQALARRGLAHSVEARQDGALVGGLYGVAIGGAFFGESMFSRVTDASKAALVHLVARLRYGGFRLLDAQFPTPHLEQFGAETIPRRIFHAVLGAALDVPADFGALPEDASADQILEVLDR